MTTTKDNPDAEKEQQQHDIRWDNLQDRLRSSIVSISFSQAFHFEHDGTYSSNATGFVVDAEQGIVLSNRHVMTTGPSVHKATFFNNQEVFLQPTYYDPIHDFAFFRYDPGDLQSSFVPKEIRLAPEKARSGMEFRVVGNNSNEKMSVHQGELSQLDRNVPEYGANTYNDFNTFYYQASSTSQGGSSGSPVVDIEGDAVAIKAGSNTKTFASFFLPLQRVVYALDYVRRWETPPRGTLQAVFKHITHVQAAHLGLDAEAAAREGVLADSANGVLTVDKVMPGGPADGKLQVGDIILSVEQMLCPGFPELSNVVDSLVGNTVTMRVFGRGEFKTVVVDAMDLYGITPSQFLHIDGAVLHNMSLELAFHSSARITGVYIAYCGRGFLTSPGVGCRKVIRAVNGVLVPDLQTLMNVLQDVSRDEPIIVKVFDHRDPRDEAVLVTQLPPVCHPSQVFTRSKVTGFWSRAPFTGMTKPMDPVPVVANGFDKLAAACAASAKAGYGAPVGIAHCIEYAAVSISSDSMCVANGQYILSESSNGFVVSKQRGIVLCSTRLVRNPTSLISIRFAGLVRVPATLAYAHPLYPVAFLKYDPASLRSADSTVDDQLTELDLSMRNGIVASEARLAVGSRATVFMGNFKGGLEIIPTSVSGRRQLSTIVCLQCLDQRFYNTEIFELSPEPSTSSGDFGVVCDADSCIRGLWVRKSCCYHDQNKKSYVGLDALLLLPTLESLHASDQNPDVVRVLDVEFTWQSLAAAKVLGVSDSYIRELAQAPPSQRGVFVVDRIMKIPQLGVGALEVGDVVLK
ncbi:hypothetical protein IWW38_003925, partial [Coemansia aciculifera]